MTVPEPRDHDEHVEPCRRHHLHMAYCPGCNDWARHVRRQQRDQADQRQARREADTR